MLMRPASATHFQAGWSCWHSLLLLLSMSVLSIGRTDVVGEFHGPEPELPHTSHYLRTSNNKTAWQHVVKLDTTMVDELEEVLRSRRGDLEGLHEGRVLLRLKTSSFIFIVSEAL
ncbi:hypothetical protein J5N97_019749 [Dioscorea zingiberensis]|uniref:Uncharacterized protein n=1 Tax=Dioscorea zingiberensis TaxID=325984 RepID=A0A9D5HCZ9_9LILI|nr:hypothetical protein J5N97_019749 [Dioscorea zingiberensis]